MKIQKGIKYIVILDFTLIQHGQSIGVGAMRDEPRDGQMSETVDRMVLKTFLDRLLTQALTL